VVGISALSTLTMIVYPRVARAIGLDTPTTGTFLGATIHDVEQVRGCWLQHVQGASLVKLIRVATLLPVIMFAVTFMRATGKAERGTVRGDGVDV